LPVAPASVDTPNKQNALTLLVDDFNDNYHEFDIKEEKELMFINNNLKS
jgi:hypothetical protein